MKKSHKETEKFANYELAIVEEQENSVVTSNLTNDTVLRRTIPWESMKNAKLISERDLTMIRKFDKRPASEREDLLDNEGEEYAGLFLNFLSNLATPDGVQYVLAIVDELLHDDKRSPLFLNLSEHNVELPFGPFLRLLNRNESDLFIKEKASKIVALLLTKSHRYNIRDVQFFCRWIAERLGNEAADVLVAVSALQILLRRREFRPIFHAEGGLRLLEIVLNDHKNKRQVLYQTLYCLWLLSYDEKIAEEFSQVPNLTPQIVEVIRKEDRVKIRRIGVAILRNLLNKGQNNEQMIKSGMVKLVVGLSQKKWKDEDIEQDLEILNETLEKDVNLFSTFELYKEEVMSGKLVWSLVHRSEKFWRENVGRFEENNFKILSVLLELIRTSIDPQVLAIACYDLGEFVRFHPRGRKILSKMDGKVDIMKLMGNPDPEVQKHALLCVQKMMVHNWEYLSKAN
jgi:V-type H+-transporting ATPase subunit H